MHRLNSVTWAVGVLAAGVLAGCGSAPARARQAAVATSGALRAWAAYPVATLPRPVVLLDSPIINPAGGFANNTDKVAYLTGTFNLGVSLPVDTPTADGAALTLAKSALDTLSAPGAPKVHLGPGLTITAVRLRRAAFSTDRGRQVMPAWAFTFRGVRHPAYVLALSESAWWPKPGMTTGADGRRMSAKVEGAHVIVSFIGPHSGSGPCGAEYAATAAESNTAVEVTLRVKPNPNATEALCALYTFPRSISVTLRAPLGNRVLITPQGVPIPAT